MKLSFRPDADIEKSLEKVAFLFDRPKNWVINEALRDYFCHLGSLAKSIKKSLRHAEKHPSAMVPHADAIAAFKDKTEHPS